MKKIFTILIFLGFIMNFSYAQHDTMYVHQTTGMIMKLAINKIDSIIFYPTAGPNTVTDVDGNVYTIVVIGTQSWLGQNLKTTRFNDGQAISLVTNNNTWDTLTNPAYCWYDNNQAYKEPYGALYNWYAVDPASNGGKNICPEGWHVPSDEEWTALTNSLGGANVAGGLLKESGTAHWNPPNTGATNETGFTALPGGYRGTAGSFVEMGVDGRWHSSTGHPTFMGSAYYRNMTSNSAQVYRHYLGKKMGFSVRCLKD